MATGKFSALAVLAIAAMLPGLDVRAQQAFTGVDGCAVLGQLIYAEVSADAWRGPAGSEQARVDAGNAGVTVCTQTTRTVSSAYTAALRAVGEEVRWGGPRGVRGDACLSGFLEQCYPERYPVGGENRWRAVQSTVLQAMPHGVASDQSVFSPHVMRLALRMSLRQDTRGH
ncbi:MAG: hypothetical protein HKN64_01820 [Woeseiaceae bacterium]|nr:hypothetical protein [Woeseiaceae bacterium]